MGEIMRNEEEIIAERIMAWKLYGDGGDWAEYFKGWYDALGWVMGGEIDE